MLRRGELQKAMGGAPLVYQSRTERLAQAKGRTYYYYFLDGSGVCLVRLCVLLSGESGDGFRGVCDSISGQ